jgi:AraC-like DNA-binding protein
MNRCSFAQFELPRADLHAMSSDRSDAGAADRAMICVLRSLCRISRTSQTARHADFGGLGWLMQRIDFDSMKLPGDPRRRADLWVDALSSGYVRLGADPVPHVPFDGRIKVVRSPQLSLGILTGTVRTIARTPTDVSIENTDNIVVLINQGVKGIRVRQKERELDVTAGGAALIEQCEPSTIAIAESDRCNLLAVQVPRAQVQRHAPRFAERLLKPYVVPWSAITLMRSYVDLLFEVQATSDFAQSALSGLSSLVGAFVNIDELPSLRSMHGSRVGRIDLVFREIERGIANAGFSLPELARRLRVSTRQVQAVLAEAGTSYTEQVSNRRLDRAREMLLSPVFAGKGVVDISQDCGFKSLAHFHRMFRRRFDMTPGEMRAGVSA